MSYRSETEIAGCLLTPGDRFLLIAARSRPGLTQLCLHKGEAQAKLPEGSTLEQQYLKQVQDEEKHIYGAPKFFDLLSAY